MLISSRHICIRSIEILKDFKQTNSDSEKKKKSKETKRKEKEKEKEKGLRN